MKKNIALILTLGISLFTNAQEKPAFTWLDFSSQNMNQTYTSGNAETVKVSINEKNLNPGASILYTQDVFNPLVAIGETMPDDKMYHRLSMLGVENETNTEKCPYILISMLDNVTPTKLQLLGVGAGYNKQVPAELIIGFSYDGTEDADFDNWDSEVSYFEIEKNNNEIFEVPENTKHIIIIAKQEFAGWDIGLKTVADIYAIRLFTDKVIVGINEDMQQKTTMRLDGENIYADQPVNIAVYSITGSKIKDVQNTQELNLAELMTGVYLVKAQSPQTGKEELLKVCIR